MNNPRSMKPGWTITRRAPGLYNVYEQLRGGKAYPIHYHDGAPITAANADAALGACARYWHEERQAVILWRAGETDRFEALGGDHGVLATCWIAAVER